MANSWQLSNLTHKLFSMYFFIYSALHVSSMSCPSSGETNCISTASGNCHSVLVAVSCARWEFTPNNCQESLHDARSTKR